MTKYRGFEIVHGASRILVRIPFIVLLTIGVGVVAANAQEIRTAESYFATVSDNFVGIEDYTCDFTISQGDSISYGKLTYKQPDLLRLDFEQPDGQVVLADGEKLQVYLPVRGIILLQSFSRPGDSSSGAPAGAPAGAMNPQGLYLLSEGYDIAYLHSPRPVPLNAPEDEEESDDEGAVPASTDEMVVKLKLTRSNSLEMFREIVLSIGEDMMIRRFRGIADDYTETITDFENVAVNQGVPDSRFEEEAWPEANVYTDCLIRTE